MCIYYTSYMLNFSFIIKAMFFSDYFLILSVDNSPSGGCSMSPVFSHVPICWMSEESTSRQKSLVLSLPSSLSRRRAPINPITVAIQTEVEFLGSRASTFIPTLKSLLGGTIDWRERESEKQQHRWDDKILCLNWTELVPTECWIHFPEINKINGD